MNIHFKKLHSLVFLCLFSLCAPALFAGLEDDGTETFDSPEEAFEAIKKAKNTSRSTEDYVVFHTPQGKFTAEPAIVNVDHDSGYSYLLNPRTQQSMWVDDTKQTWVANTDDLADYSAHAARARSLASTASTSPAARSTVSGSTILSDRSDYSADGDDRAFMPDVLRRTRPPLGGSPGDVDAVSSPSSVAVDMVISPSRTLPASETIGDLAGRFPRGVKINGVDVSDFVQTTARAFDSASKENRLLYMQALRSLETLSGGREEAHAGLSELVTRMQDTLHSDNKLSPEQINADEGPTVFNDALRQLNRTRTESSTTLLTGTAVDKLRDALATHTAAVAKQRAATRTRSSADDSRLSPAGRSNRGLFAGLETASSSDWLTMAADEDFPRTPPRSNAPRKALPVSPASPTVSVRTKPLTDKEEQAQAELEKELTKLRAASQQQVVDETSRKVKPLGAKVRRALQEIYDHSDATAGSLKPKIKKLQAAVGELSADVLADADVQRNLDSLEVSVRAAAQVTGDQDLLATPLRTHGLTTQLDKKIKAVEAEIKKNAATADAETRWMPGKRDAKLRAEARIAALQAQKAALIELQDRAIRRGTTPQEMLDALNAVHVVHSEATDEETLKLTTELFRAKRAEAYARALKEGTAQKDIPFPTTLKGEEERKRLVTEARRAVAEQFKKVASSEDNIKAAKTLLAKRTAALAAFERFQAAQAGMEASGAKKTEDIDARLTELRRTEAVLHASLLELTKKVATASLEEQRAQLLLADHLRLRNADLQKRIKDLEKFKEEQNPDYKARKKAAEKLAKLEYAVEAAEVSPVVAAVTPVETPRPKFSSRRVVPGDAVMEEAPDAAKPRGVVRRTDSADSVETAGSSDSHLIEKPSELDVRRPKPQGKGADERFVEEGRGRSRSPQPTRDRDAVVKAQEGGPSRRSSRPQPVSAIVMLDEKRHGRTADSFEREARRTPEKRGSASRTTDRSGFTRLSQFTADSTDASGRSRGTQQKPSSQPSSSARPSTDYRILTRRSEMKAAREARAKSDAQRKAITGR